MNSNKLISSTHLEAKPYVFARQIQIPTVASIARRHMELQQMQRPGEPSFLLSRGLIAHVGKLLGL